MVRKTSNNNFFAISYYSVYEAPDLHKHFTILYSYKNIFSIFKQFLNFIRYEERTSKQYSKSQYKHQGRIARTSKSLYIG